MQAQPMPCRLAAHDLACRRGDRLLFAGLSLALEPGEACHIRGANGVGKSSLIRILAGLAAPWAGSIERQGMAGLVDDRAALDERVPLGRALEFWARLDRQHEPDPELLKRLGLTDLLDVPVAYLSSGQRKRAALARLATQNAPIWLLDEPLNGLDSDAAVLTEALTAEHLGRGGICVLASHQPFALPQASSLDLAAFAP